MHFQHPPHVEMKLVSCLRGEVFDVAVDIRRDSATFLHWHGELLSDTNHKSLLIPEGFAHGFQSLTPNCELLYLHTAAYVPDAAGALHALDPALEIEWPLEIGEMSQRDRSHPFIDERFRGVSP
jgi:dTDP-4-dehydrorhamnose 3,5-epimerase